MSRSDALRILVLSAFPPDGGGGEMQTRVQLAEITRLGHAVTVIDLRARASGPDEEYVDGVRVLRIRLSQAPGIRSAHFHLRLAALAVRLARDADVAQFNHIGAALLSAAPVLGLLRVPRIVVIWGSAAPGIGPFGPGLLFGAARWVARRFARCVALASVSVGHLRRDGFDPERIVVIPNGVDTARFRPRDPSAADAQPCGWPESGPVVLTVGRLVEAKGLDVLLDAWARARGASPGARLVLVGEGPLREEVLRLRAKLGLESSVVLLGARSDIPACLRHADAYVSASRTEGMSNALLEAMACGLPIVATRVGAAEDLIADSVSGILVAPEDPRALAHALGTVLADAPRRAAMGDAARERAVREFSIASVGARYVTLYEDLRAQARRSRS